MHERQNIKTHFELEVYKRAFSAAMKIFQLSKNFPQEERYSLTNRIRRSSRSVCANNAEAWRKRRYPAHWASQLSDCEAEAAETQTWLKFAADCGYLTQEAETELHNEYNEIIAMLVIMITHQEKWTIR